MKQGSKGVMSEWGLYVRRDCPNVKCGGGGVVGDGLLIMGEVAPVLVPWQEPILSQQHSWCQPGDRKPNY